MSKFGPSRTELKVRLAISAAGLALMVFALLFRGIPTSAGGWEAIGIAAIFFGGSFVWTLRKLLKVEHS